MKIVWSLLVWIFAPQISFANYSLGLFSENRISSIAENNFEAQQGTGLSFEYQHKKYRYSFEFVEFSSIEQGSVMRFENERLELRPWVHIEMKKTPRFSVLSGASAGLYQDKTSIQFYSERQAGESDWQAILGLGLRGELYLWQQLSLNAEGRLFWMQGNSFDPAAALSAQVNFQF